MNALVKRLTDAKKLNVTAYNVLAKGKRINSVSWAATAEEDKKAVVKQFPTSATPADPDPVSAATSVTIEVFETAEQEKPSFAIGVVGDRITVEEKGKTKAYTAPDKKLFDELTRIAGEKSGN